MAEMSGQMDYDDVRDWIAAINMAVKRNSRGWWAKADRVVKRYRDERMSNLDTAKKFNILWSNVETLKPAIYGQTPKPEVGRRYKDADPVGRQASMILERALSYSMDAYDFDGEVRSSVEDYLLPGCGTIRVRYKPSYGDEVRPKTRLMATETEYLDDQGNGYTEDQITFDQEGPFIPGEPYTPVVYEESECEYVFWKDFIWGPGRRWKDVPWAGFAAYMDRQELIERFGEEIGSQIKLDCYQEDIDQYDENNQYKMEKKARIWEIWDKKRRKVRWISLSYKDDFLDVDDPPLNLNGFYPCPKPIMSVKTNNTMDPIPEYCMYQDQAEEIDTLTKRIARLLPQIKIAGAYPGAEKDVLGRLMTEMSENKLIAVDSWAMFAERGGVEGMISWWPTQQVIETVIRLYEAREKTKQELYEITGIADIIRGASNAAETATAQRIKGQFATLRLSDRQKQVSEFVRDVLRLKAEVMCEHFSAQTFQLMTGLQCPPEVMQLFRNDPIRGFRIDIETDSTLMADEEMDKRSRIEFLEAMTNFMGTLMPMAQQAPELAPLLGEMVLFGVRGFKAGRQLEESIEQALEAMKQTAAQAQQQPPQPDPKQIEAQARAQKIQQEMQMDQAKLQQEMQIDQAKLQHETQLDNAKFQQDAQIQQAEFGLRQQQVEQDMELAKLKARLGNL